MNTKSKSYRRTHKTAFRPYAGFYAETNLEGTTLHDTLHLDSYDLFDGLGILRTSQDGIILDRTQLTELRNSINNLLGSIDHYQKEGN